MHRYPESPVFYRSLRRALPLIVRGQGCWLYDEEGRAYLDACGGAYVANLGHGDGKISAAVAEQIQTVSYVNGTAFTNQAVEGLAAEMRELVPIEGAYSYFLSSGSEANEAALKLARQYWVEAGRPEKSRILARSPGYHGNTLLAMSVSARASYKEMFAPWLIDVDFVAAPDHYRYAEDHPAMTGEALEQQILQVGADQIAAFIAEPVGGSSTGAMVPPEGYWQRVREICDRYEILLICDEVLSGAGRTGTWTAIEQYGIAPDIITMGKGISGGYVPLSSVIASPKVVDMLNSGTGAFRHAQTFSHSPTMCAAGLAAVRAIRAKDLMGRVRELGPVFLEKLQALREIPQVGDVRGKGLLAAIELVGDRGSKRPFPRRDQVAERVAEEGLKHGLVVWVSSGHWQGDGDLVMLAPPFIIEPEEIDVMVEKLRVTLEAVFS